MRISALLVSVVAGGALLGATYRLERLPEVRRNLGVSDYTTSDIRAGLRKLKIAVLDNGFGEYDAKSNVLPSDTKLVTSYPKDFIERFELGDPKVNIEPAATNHGTMMAHLVWGLSGYDRRGPQFLLLNASGITNFRRAVRYAMEQKVDVVLYSQNWECCGNFDGGGFVNELVDQAIDQGILWVNAAGNYHNSVFNGPIGRKLRLKSHFDDNPVQIILNWNSYGEAENSGTDKDLDLYLLDEKGKIVARSELKQVRGKAKLEKGESFLPRERIQCQLERNRSGFYRIVVKDKSRNFTSDDRVRIVVIPGKPPFPDARRRALVPAAELVDATKGGEIMVPADNPRVLTVGDLGPESAVGPTTDGRRKPDVVLETSLARFTTGNASMGTSNAAAYFAAAVLLMKANQPGLSRRDILAGGRPDPVDPLATEIAVSKVARRKRTIYKLVSRLCRERPVSAGRYGEGHYFLAVSNPDEGLAKRCGLSREDFGRYEIYLRETEEDPFSLDRDDNVLCVLRTKTKAAGTPLFPWETDGGKAGDYVRVVSTTDVPVESARKATKKRSKIWRAPPP